MMCGYCGVMLLVAGRCRLWRCGIAALWHCGVLVLVAGHPLLICSYLPSLCQVAHNVRLFMPGLPPPPTSSTSLTHRLRLFSPAPSHLRTNTHCLIPSFVSPYDHTLRYKSIHLEHLLCKVPEWLATEGTHTGNANYKPILHVPFSR